MEPSNALPPAPLPAAPTLEGVRSVVARLWGHPRLFPEQERAIAATLAGRDALVVLPTGGGKSLCYQGPAAAGEGLTVVVSPLIALMKDQVDGLTRVGVPAARLDSSLDGAARRRVEDELAAGRLRLLFLSPERAAQPETRSLLARLRPAALAIDEAHCISHWGHDFRPEYRRLAELRAVLPGVPWQALTATATARVRADIAAQLALEDPEEIVGRFDRPNLVYRVLPRTRVAPLASAAVERHRGEAAIVYCMTRREVDRWAERFQALGHRAGRYHAGMEAADREAVQQAFAEERLDVVVATVAFGMGVDRSNVRLVLHLAAPKSIEHYQQETGRAGRDGLPAECVLLYSEADVLRWRELQRRARAEAPAADPEVERAADRQLEEMARYCRGAVCRHRALSAYFGQELAGENCGACDLCLGEADEVEEAGVVAQKILSCVARVGQRFGVEHVVKVLRGTVDAAVEQRGHQELSTFGLLREVPVADLRDWIYQLIGQGALARREGDYPVLELTATSRGVLRGETPVRLVRIARPQRGAAAPRTRVESEAWEGVDRELFERLRTLRRELAAAQQVPPYVIFHDSTLRDLARRRPVTLDEMATVRGIGERKLADYGAAFLEVLRGEG